ncbi:uncharacterized protein LOC112327616 [Populus trichocarpa]|uniref:uncharacterized protein LOC112327616 n=1 Tax=Populus trichocarpa TaxID=3694 RepID=UPI002277DB89|nr:uncharacterized protein LOC112327616 [Populus trichocarpa]
MKLDLFNLKSAEKTFFAQKLKCNFFKESDIGTSFFHALISQKHMRNFIPAIQRSNGALTTSLDEVGDEFVHYYQNLFGTSSSTTPIDDVVVHSGPCLNETHFDFLLAPVSNDVIKEALFSIVQDFFTSGQILKQINHSIIALVPKSTNVASANDFRPISCCNVVYKVISKILAGRLSYAFQDIIDPT